MRSSSSRSSDMNGTSNTKAKTSRSAEARREVNATSSVDRKPSEAVLSPEPLAEAGAAMSSFWRPAQTLFIDVVLICRCPARALLAANLCTGRRWPRSECSSLLLCRKDSPY